MNQREQINLQSTEARKCSKFGEKTKQTFFFYETSILIYITEGLFMSLILSAWIEIQRTRQRAWGKYLH